YGQATRARSGWRGTAHQLQVRRARRWPSPADVTPSNERSSDVAFIDLYSPPARRGVGVRRAGRKWQPRQGPLLECAPRQGLYAFEWPLGLLRQSVVQPCRAAGLGSRRSAPHWHPLAAGADGIVAPRCCQIGVALSRSTRTTGATP